MLAHSLPAAATRYSYVDQQPYGAPGASPLLFVSAVLAGAYATLGVLFARAFDLTM